MIKKIIALSLVLLTVVILSSCTLSDLFSNPEDESTTEWTMLSTTEAELTEWVTETFTVEEEVSVDAEHDCAVNGHIWKNATCYAPKTCAACGLTEGSKLDHSYKSATCTSPQRCRYCGKTVGNALGHDWDANGKCTRCGALKSSSGSSNGSATCEHQWMDATCSKPRTCALCGKTSGSPNKHNYAAATCEKPQTCRNCGATTGSALGHSYAANGYCTRCHKNRSGEIDPSWTASKTTTSTTAAPAPTEPTAPPAPTEPSSVAPPATSSTTTNPPPTEPTAPPAPTEPTTTTTTTEPVVWAPIS